MFSNTITQAMNNLWPLLTIVLVVLIAVRIAYIRNNSKEFVLYREVLNLVFVIYLLLLFEMVTNKDISGTSGINLVPFTEIFRYSFGSKQFLYNVVGNIAVFVPFGYFVSYIIRSKKVGSIFLITLITSFTIEFVQLRIGRAFDIDDIILNVVGGIAGWLLYIGLSAIKNHLPKIFRKDIIYNILCVILLIVMILYAANIFGFGWKF